jgi:hypothetical protein
MLKISEEFRIEGKGKREVYIFEKCKKLRNNYIKKISKIIKK